jgi:hypothetical protein
MHNSDYYREEAAKYRKLAEGEKGRRRQARIFGISSGLRRSG